MSVTRRIGHLIDGKWIFPDDGEMLRNVNPATLEPVADVHAARREDLDAAVAAANRAFRGWRDLPAPKRGEYLYRLADLLKARKGELARLLTMEMGKVLKEAEGEVQEAIDMACYMAGEGRRLTGQVVPSELPDKWAMCVREPVGVVGAISAFNFPIAVPSWKIMPALILGNTVVWKPSPNTSATAAAFARAFLDAGFPPGVLNVLAGGGPEIGQALAEHEGVHMISFTGSSETGKAVYRLAAGQLKKVSLELGGKNAVIVLEDADPDLAAEGILWAAFGTSGQRCTAASRAIIVRDVYEPLVERLLEGVKTIRIGNGLDPDVTLGPLINRAALERVAGYVESARRQGIPVLCGGHPVPELKGHFFAPTILGPVDWHSAPAQEEIFGPVLSLIVVDDPEEAIAANNAAAYGLSSAIFTRDLNRAMRAVRRLDTGIVYVNHGTTGSEVQLPFGGTKNTGNGTREAGQAALDAFSEWKTVYIDYSGRLQRAQIDTEHIVG